jgi:Lipocalin-like domain
MTHSKILAFCLLLLSVACNKDDDANNSGNDLSGTWKLTAISSEGTTSTTGPGTAISGTFKTTGKDYKAQVTFKNDGTFVSSGTYTAVATTTIGGQTFTQEQPIQDFLGNGTWKRAGNKLTVTVNGVTTEATIAEETDKKLRIAGTFDRSTTASGLTVVQKGTISQTIER